MSTKKANEEDFQNPKAGDLLDMKCMHCGYPVTMVHSFKEFYTDQMLVNRACCDCDGISQGFMSFYQYSHAWLGWSGSPFPPIESGVQDEW